MTYEWSDNNGVKQTTAWSKKVRKAMVRGQLEKKPQDTNAGLHSIGQAASMGVQGDLMSNERWVKGCLLQNVKGIFIGMFRVAQRHHKRR
jgi:hypothetical protein